MMTNREIELLDAIQILREQKDNIALVSPNEVFEIQEIVHCLQDNAAIIKIKPVRKT